MYNTTTPPWAGSSSTGTTTWPRTYEDLYNEYLGPHLDIDSAEVRDFLVDLCKLTQQDAPDDEEWLDLRQRTKELMAKFALRQRRMREQGSELEKERYAAQLKLQLLQYQLPLQFAADSTTSAYYSPNISTATPSTAPSVTVTL